MEIFTQWDGITIRSTKSQPLGRDCIVGLSWLHFYSVAYGQRTTDEFPTTSCALVERIIKNRHLKPITGNRKVLVRDNRTAFDFMIFLVLAPAFGEQFSC